MANICMLVILSLFIFTETVRPDLNPLPTPV